MATTKARNPKKVASTKVVLNDDVIAIRAYEKWLTRGCPIGEDTNDWFAAKTELEQELAQKKKVKTQSAS